MTKAELDRLNQIQHETRAISNFLETVSRAHRRNNTWLSKVMGRINEFRFSYGAFNGTLQLSPEDEQAICDYLQQKLERLRKEFAVAGGKADG